MNTTYCIGTYNTLNYLKLCVESIYNNSFYKDFNVYIYSEGSIDGTDEWLQNEFSKLPNTKFWGYPEKWDIKYHGVGGAMNFLAEQVTTPNIFFLHSDMYCGPNFDKYLIDNIKEDLVISSHRIEPNVFNQKNNSKGPIWSLRPGTLCCDLDIFGHTYKDFDKEKFDDFAKQFIERNNYSIPRGEGAGGHILTKVTWDKAGGCDSMFSPASYDDMDLFVRMQLKNIKFELTGKSLLFHFGSRTCHFPGDNLSKSSDRQIDSERANQRKWLTKWNKFPVNDNIGFVSAEGMKIIDDNNQYR